jgi:hypothetical protein
MTQLPTREQMFEYATAELERAYQALGERG